MFFCSHYKPLQKPPFPLEFLHGLMRRCIALECDLLGDAPLLVGLLQELFGGRHIAVFTQEKINGLSLFVHASIKIDPFAFELYVGSSGAGESHPHALTEPNVTLPSHSARIVQPSPERTASEQTAPAA